MREAREGFPHRWSACNVRKFSDVGDDAPARVVLASYDRDNGLGKRDHDVDDGRCDMNNDDHKVIDNGSDTRNGTEGTADNGRHSRSSSSGC